MRWAFEDPNTLQTYVFPVNPSEGGTPSYDKQIQYQNTSAPDGKVISFEGRDQVQPFEFSGVLFTEAELNAFVTWWGKRYQIKVTDDLGREFWIEIRSFKPTRVRAVQHPYKHNYQVSAVIVDWP